MRLNGSQLSAAQHATAAARQDFPTGTHHSSIGQGKPSHAGTFFAAAFAGPADWAGHRAQGTGHEVFGRGTRPPHQRCCGCLAACCGSAPLAPRPSPRPAAWALFSANVSARARSRSRSLVHSAQAQRLGDPQGALALGPGPMPQPHRPHRHRHGGSRRKNKFSSCGANANGDNNNNSNIH